MRAVGFKDSFRKIHENKRYLEVTLLMNLWDYHHIEMKTYHCNVLGISMEFIAGT